MSLSCLAQAMPLPSVGLNGHKYASISFLMVIRREIVHLIFTLAVGVSEPFGSSNDTAVDWVERDD